MKYLFYINVINKSRFLYYNVVNFILNSKRKLDIEYIYNIGFFYNGAIIIRNYVTVRPFYINIANYNIF